MNAEDKKMLAKMSSKEYYHESKFSWNVSKQKKCYARCITSEAWKNTYKKYSWWKKEMMKEVMTPKTHVMNELKKYTAFVFSYVDKGLELHFKNPFMK
jgi:hypothetical protein